jgi:trimethylamine--corrinoid protein Co-methyltransferase
MNMKLSRSSCSEDASVTEKSSEVTLEVLDEAAIAQIDAAAMEILGRTGVAAHDRAACDRLKRAGAKVDEASCTTRLPEELVREAIVTARTEFVLRDATGTAYPIRFGSAYMGTQGYVPHFWDYSSRSLRVPGEAEVVGWTRLADALPGVRLVQPITQDWKLSPLESALRMSRAVVLNTTKTWLAQPLAPEEAEIWLDLSHLVADANGSDRRGLVAMMASTISPLQIDAKNVFLVRYTAEHEIPLFFIPGPLSGATAPITLAGALALQVAETLAALVLSQTIRPGAPFIFGLCAHNIDLRTGNTCLGSVEHCLLKSATGQIARHYGLPFFNPMGMSEAGAPDVQAGIEKTMAILLTVLGGASVTSASGSLGASTIAAYEQLAIDHEIYLMAKRLAEGIAVNRETLARDVIARVGIGGSYLADEHTIALMRSGEHFLPRLMNRDGPRGIGMLERAHKAVTTTLAEHKPAVSDAARDAVDRYIEKRLAERLP